MGRVKFRESFRAQGRFLLLGLIFFLLIGAGALWWALDVLRPMPPRTVVMATGPQGGAYAEWGARYREILAAHGFEVRLLPTAGALENLARLRDPRSEVSIAFVQAGLAAKEDAQRMASLGTLSFEPLWLFCRGGPQDKGRADLLGGRLSIGPEGSGTRALMLRILALNGIDEKDAELLSLFPEETKERLLRGEIDAAAFAASWESPLVRQLLACPEIGLFSFPRADAYLALHPYLNKVVVPVGVGDLANNLPPAPASLLAPKASLIIRQDLHPALQFLFLDAASQVHSGPGFFHKAGQFPAPEPVDLPLSAEARHFYKSGPPFLQRYLPFWLAVLAERMVILLIPILGVLYPIFRFTPPLYAWGMQRRILKLYGELKLLEIQLGERPGGESLADLGSRLDELDRRVHQVGVPVTFMPMVYTLRQHIDLARERLDKRSAQSIKTEESS